MAGRHGQARCFEFLVLTVLCFGPALVLQVWSDGDYPWLVWVLAFLGCAYFPMGFLGLAMFDSLVALNPKFVVGSMLRVPGEYAISVLVFGAILVSRWLLRAVARPPDEIPLAPPSSPT